MSANAILSRNKLVLQIMKATRELGWPSGTPLDLAIDAKKQTITITKAQPNAKPVPKPAGESPAPAKPDSPIAEPAGDPSF